MSGIKYKPSDRAQILAMRLQGMTVAEISTALFPNAPVLADTFINRVLDDAELPRRLRYRSTGIAERAASRPDHDTARMGA